MRASVVEASPRGRAHAAPGAPAAQPGSGLGMGWETDVENPWFPGENDLLGGFFAH